MKKKALKKTHTQTGPELQKELSDNREKLWKLRKELHAGKIKNVRASKAVRKDIAQIMTILNSKKQK